MAGCKRVESFSPEAVPCVERLHSELPQTVAYLLSEREHNRREFFFFLQNHSSFYCTCVYGVRRSVNLLIRGISSFVVRFCTYISRLFSIFYLSRTAPLLRTLVFARFSYAVRCGPHWILQDRGEIPARPPSCTPCAPHTPCRQGAAPTKKPPLGSTHKPLHQS